MAETYAPGWPGIPPRWTSSAKSGVGTALSGSSDLWFTISHGVVNEIYYPRIDHACTRDMEFIVTGPEGFLSEEKRDAQHEIERSAPGAPAYRLRNTVADRYRIEKEIISDPARPVLLHRMRFRALAGRNADYRLHLLIAPHLGNRGGGNTAWTGEYKGRPMLFAERSGVALAVACSEPWSNRSAGFVGTSDGWHDLHEHHEMTWNYQRAENGNVALMGGIVIPPDDAEFLVVVGFGTNADEAGHRARAALHDGFDAAYATYVRNWDAWQDRLLHLDEDRQNDPSDRYRISTIVMRTHEATDFPGGVIASLSIPWGFNKGDEDLGGYHLCWPRDLVETAGGLLAVGAHDEVRRILSYLQTTQEPDGHWGQNMWLDGTPYWNGIQMDETALPIVLVDLARREGALTDPDLLRFWPMVRRAAGYIVRNGPVSPQDRWEEDPGYSPFTVAAQIAALLVAAEFARRFEEPDVANYLVETADVWNDCIDHWMYASGTERNVRFDVDGYYVRVAPLETDDETARLQSSVPVKNVAPSEAGSAACDLISCDALALVRFGLRAADDPRILNTIRLIDRILKVETPAGPCWHRYNGDGYGEHADGSPFDGTGIGRAWPLLTGERAHYELQAGHHEEARSLLAAFERMASGSGLLPEQIWDAADIPDRELFFGRAAGSAMPLVWAHAEYAKLRRSLHDGAVFDLPPATVRRYLVNRAVPAYSTWRFNQKIRILGPGRTLRIETMAPAWIHWTDDDWATARDHPSRDTGFDVHVTDLPTASLAPGDRVQFTMFWPEADRWEGTNFAVTVADSEKGSDAA